MSVAYRPTLRISDHALVRWLERSNAVDVAAMKALLATSLDHAAREAQKLGVTDFVILADGLAYLIKDGLVVTVVPDNGPGSRVNVHRRANTVTPAAPA